MSILIYMKTTSATLAWTLYALAMNPTMQDKVRQDVLAVIQRGDNITWDTLEELTYLGNIIKETLR